MKKLKILDLFSGIGGFSLGLEATGGFETAAFCEIDPYCRSVLKKHWPGVPIFEDIRKLKGTDIGTVDIITGGYPCQPFSVAGKQKGVEDKRHLWPEYFRIIKECRPTWVIGENVSGHIKLGLDSVIEDLESEGYAARTFSISASSVGANHQRERIWIVANSDSSGSESAQPAIIGEQKNKEIGNGQTDDTARITSGANSTFPEQGGETKMELMANSENIGLTTGLYETKRQGNTPRCSEGEFKGNSSDVANASGVRRQNFGGNDGKNGPEKFQQENVQFGNQCQIHTSDVANAYGVNDAIGRVDRTIQETGGSGSIDERGSGTNANGFSHSSKNETLDSKKQFTNQNYWKTEPNVGRVVNGVPNRVDRLKALGNSLVPQIPFYIGQSIIQTLNVENADTAGQQDRSE